MQIKTILNLVQKFKSFVYGTVRLAEDAQEPTLEVEVPHEQTAALSVQSVVADVVDMTDCRSDDSSSYPCGASRCSSSMPLDGRTVLPVVFVLNGCPWASGKNQLTQSYAWFLAGWAKRLSWKEVAEAFRTSWDHVFKSVEMAVSWGRAHQDLSNIEAIGVDEIQWQRGHQYLTVVYQIDAHCKRLLWVGEKRTVKTLLRFYRWFGKERSAALRYVCSDMWKPYLKVIAKKAGQALHILDRFHIMSYLSKAIDQVRAQEVNELKAKGYEPVLTKSRWLLLKRPENLTEKQEIKLAELVQYNLKSVRSYLLKEAFQSFWAYKSPYWAGKFLDTWCTKTMRTKIEPMKKVAGMLRRHKLLLLNWFRAKGQFSSGIVEGFNTKAKLTTRKAYGFRTFHAAEVALYHALGALPVPETTHKFF